jgi:hypothetical protein
MATLDQLNAALIKADAAGNADDAKAFASEIRRMRAEPTTIKAPVVNVGRQPDAIPERDMIQTYGYPALETAAAIGGGLVGAVPGTIGGPAGVAIGGALGSGLGYAGAKQLEKAYDTFKGQNKAQSFGANAQEATSDFIYGILTDLGGQIVLKPAAKAAGWIWDTATGKLIQVKAGKIVRELAGDAVDAVRAAAASAPANLTAGQATANVRAPAIQTLQARMNARNINESTALAEQEVADRAANLQRVTPDKAAAEAARTAGTKPYYAISDKTIVPIDNELKSIFERLPEGTITAAKELAKREGRPFIFGETIPGTQAATRTGGTPQITGESLHYIKRALSDIVTSPATKNAGIDAQRVTQGVLNDYVNLVETKIPEYGIARQAFKTGSEPVNQAVVLNKMREILSTKEGRESAKPFLNALGKGEQALLKKATGYPRYQEGDLSKLLTPQQMDTVTDIAAQLDRNLVMAEYAGLGKDRYANTLRKETGLFRIPNILSPKVAVTNEGLRLLEGKINEKLMLELEKGVQSGKSLVKLIDTLPASDRNLVLRILKSRTGSRGTTFGVNALASDPSFDTEAYNNRNALAQ